MSRKRVLFIGGSLNQTTQMHAVAKHLGDYEQAFTYYYGDAFHRAARAAGLLEFSILGRKRQRWCLDYLRAAGLPVDPEGAHGPYDLVVTSSDLVVPQNVRGAGVLVVQEGILDPESHLTPLIRRLPHLAYPLAGTALTGQSGAFDAICVASEGYREHLVERGVPAARVFATGIPNFDDCDAYRRNDFPLRGYVLVCLSDTGETFKGDDPREFLRTARYIAAGRPVLVKLHPNQSLRRMQGVVRDVLPDAVVLREGSAEAMIANCDVLVTQYSSVVFVGLALGKPCYSHFTAAELRRLQPIQNGGTSARAIASLCRDLLEGRAPNQPTGPAAAAKIVPLSRRAS
jgi:hypothetical protein